ncbi:hypothetical protein BYT27DRAFT_7220809 [Phlegmacium glaucopus]|nr:hypothetical protein BYT27DRAFT_7220809 [Phlegmacium glaucopus]
MQGFVVLPISSILLQKQKPKRKKSTTPIPSDDPIFDDDIAAVEEAEYDAQVEQDDEGQIAHDEPTVWSIYDQAIEFMREQREELALNLFPKVAGLARQIQDSLPLKEKFKDLVLRDPELQSSMRDSLARRVPTRWNSDFDCLYSHLYFKTVVQSMTGVTENKLKAYRLSEDQWDLAEDLQAVLVLFKDLTELFSKADIPLVVEAVPMLLLLCSRLVLDTDSEENGLDHPTPAVIRIASQAAVLLIEKYLDLLWDCDIYIIAIVMYPDHKTGWFKEHLKYSAAEIKRIKTIVVKAWKSKYAPQDQPESSQVQKKDKSRKGKLKNEVVHTNLYNSNSFMVI